MPDAYVLLTTHEMYGEKNDLFATEGDAFLYAIKEIQRELDSESYPFEDADRVLSTAVLLLTRGRPFLLEARQDGSGFCADPDQLFDVTLTWQIKKVSLENFGGK